MPARTGRGIAKIDADQLRGSVQWNTDKNPDVTSVPVMLHPTDVFDERAGHAAPHRRVRREGHRVPEMRVISPAKLTELKTAAEGFATA